MSTDFLYRFTVTTGRADVKKLKEYSITEEKLRTKVLAYQVGAKDGDAIIPALFKKCGDVCVNRKKQKTHATDCGGNADHRLSDNVVAMTWLGADLDDITPEAFNAILSRLKTLHLQFVWWHTHSHRPESPTIRARVMIPFNEPLPIKSTTQWSKIAWPALMRHVGFALEGLDTSCRDPARVFYSPRKPSAELPHESHFVEGAPLVWKAVLGDFSSLPSPEEFEVMPAPDEDPSRPVDLAKFKELLSGSQNDYARKAGRGLALTPAPTKRVAGEISRYEAWRAVTSVLSMFIEGWESSAALLELLRPSWLAEVTESPDDHTAFETVADLLASARQSAPAKKAQRAAEMAALEKAFLKKAEASVKREEAKQVAIVPAVPEEKPSTDWESELTFSQSRKDGPKLKNTMRNASLILTNHASWRGALRKNLLTHEVEIWGGPLLRAGQKPGRQLDDDDVTFAQLWLSKHYDIEPSAATLWAILLATGAVLEYDPLIDYLRGLKWDGVPRLGTWLQKYTGAPTIGNDGEDIKTYLSAVGTKWAISAVARALSPGCKVDTVLSLEGAQGKKKSTLFKTLGGPFFSDAKVDFTQKDTLLLLNRYWIIELAEVESLRRSEVATQRAFLSRADDDYRSPYGRTIKRCPRRSVFVGTSNEDDYLQDAAGNRRHWPVLTGELDLEGLSEMRDQFWAEAVALFDAGAIWYLTPEEQTQANQQTEHRQSSDLFADQIVEWIASKPKDARPEFVSTLTVCRDALGETPTRGIEMRLSRALKKCGFTKTRRGLTRGYLIPKHLLEAPNPAPRQGLKALPGIR